MHYLTICILFVVVQVGARDDVAIKGDRFIGVAFDATTGSVTPSSVEEVTQSFGKASIFTIKSADDIEVTTLTAGQFSISTKEITTISEVSKEVTTSISVSGTYKGVTGSASATVREFASRFSSDTAKSYVADSSVVVAKVRLISATLNQEFLDDVDSLPQNFSESSASEFASFFKKWGTHYIRDATLGGRTSFTSFLTASQEQILKELDVDVKAGVSDAFKVAVNVEVERASKERNYQAVSSQGVETRAFAYGGTVGKVEDYSAWADTVAENPMPIIMDLEPYVFLVANEVKREALITALVSYYKGSLNADNTLKVEWKTLGNFYSDSGTGADRDLDAARMTLNGAEKSVGDTSLEYQTAGALTELSPGDEFFQISKQFSAPLLKYPVEWSLVWTDKGSGGDQDVGFWNPVCPDNYIGMGSRFQLGYDKPALVNNELVCVHSRCAVPCTNGKNVWDDKGSGADEDVTLWAILASDEGTALQNLVAYGSYGDPPKNLFWCIKTKCIAQPLVWDADLEAEVRSYFDQKPDAIESVNLAEQVVLNLVLLVFGVSCSCLF